MVKILLAYNVEKKVTNKTKKVNKKANETIQVYRENILISDNQKGSIISIFLVVFIVASSYLIAVVIVLQLVKVVNVGKMIKIGCNRGEEVTCKG